MDRTCSTYGKKGEAYIGFCWGNLRERSHLEDLCVDGRNILIQIFKKNYDDGVDRIYLAQDDDRWLGSCERGDQNSGFIKCVEFLD
jgi:hypothetical protein